MQQRGTFSITTLMLIALEQRPLTRTRIMQKLTLTYSRTNRHLQTLINQELISCDSISRTFSITEKGRKVLILNRQLAAYISPVDSMIRKYSRYLRDPYGNDDDGIDYSQKAVQQYNTGESSRSKLGMVH
jgi:predicted transcriptional regulator